MNHLNPGLISAYNSLTDKHLAGYFSNTRIRRHLQRAGLITRSGRIVPDKEYRQKLIQKAHQRHVRECLAQAIFHKVLEMERIHQIEIKRKLEEFARRERVHKIKVERSKRYEEDIIRILSPRPPTGARGMRKQHSGPEVEHSESSESPGSSRPNTAPGKMQRPVRLKPLPNNNTTALLRHSSPYRRHDPPDDHERTFNGTMDKDSRRHTMEVRNGISPYCLPVINNFVTPVPPTTKRKDRPVKINTSGTHRGRRLRPTTASSGADVSEETPMLRSSVPQSRVCVNMVYLGKTVHLSNDLPDLRDEVKVFQQHCGGENLCVFKGRLREGENFQFISRRHRGFPFSLTFFLNGLQVERLSSCCEFKHRKSSRLGGRHGHFAIAGVEAASPCYKCIIAMGLDKKPVPPPKRVKEDTVRVAIVPRLKVTAGEDTETTKEDTASRSECEPSPRKDPETQVKEDIAPGDHKVRDDYEEDFEADDEGPAEEEKKSPPLTGDKRGKEKDKSESEDSDKEDDIKSQSGSSFSGSDREESEAEEVKEAKVEEEAEKPEDTCEDVQEETMAPSQETHRADAEAAQATVAESAEAKDSEIQDSAGQSTEIEICDTPVPSGSDNRATTDTQGQGESKQEEPERAKSVQEKLAEAILKESHCSSEPELSDTSTETEEGSRNKTPTKQTNVAEAAPETSTEQQEVIEEEKKLEVTETSKETVEVQQEVVKAGDEKPKDDDKIVENDKVSEKAASEVGKNEDTGELEVCEEVVEEDKTLASQDKPSEEEKNEEETVQEATKSEHEDESAASDFNKKVDETAAVDNTEALTATETMEMKEEALETQEAICSEEAPVTDAHRQANVQEITVENIAEKSQENAQDENISEDMKEEKEVDNGDQELNEKLMTEDADMNKQQIEEAEKDGVKDDAENMAKQEKVEAETNLNTEGQEAEKPSEEVEKVGIDSTQIEDTSTEKPDGMTNDDGENMETKQENVEAVTNLNTEGQQEEKMSSEKDSSKKPSEEVEKIGIDNNQIEDKSTEKPDGMSNDDGENMETKQENVEAVTNLNTEGQEEEKMSIEKDSSEKPSEEVEKVGIDSTQIEDTSTEKPDGMSNDDGENMETKQENVEAVTNFNTEAREEEVMSIEKDSSEKPSEEVEMVGRDSNQIEDTSTETLGRKSNNDGESMGKDIEEDNEKAEREVKNDDLKDQKVGESEKQESILETVVEEGTIADKDSVKFTEENVKEEVSAVQEAPEVLSNVPEPQDKENSEKGEVDAENGEISVVTETKQTVESVEEVQKQAETEKATENITEVGKDEIGKSNEANDQEKALSETKEECEKNAQDDVNEGESVQSNQDAKPKDNHLDSTIKNKKMESTPPESNTEKCTDQLVATLDVSGENGDTEEASKASEEGASILLKPQVASSPHDEHAEQKGSPEGLTTADSADLVTNWVTMHQTSKYFETFVEPLEEIRDVNSEVSNTQSLEPVGSESPVKMVRATVNGQISEADKSNTMENEGKERSDLGSSPSESKKGRPPTDEVQSEESKVIHVPNIENEESIKEEDKVDNSIDGDKVHDDLVQLNNNSITRTSLTDSHLSVISSKLERVAENQNEKKATSDSGQDVSVTQTNNQVVSKSEELPETSGDVKTSEPTITEEKTEEATVTTDLMVSKSDNRSPEQSHKTPEESISADKTEMIEDTDHSLNKDCLSSFSVDEALFGRSPYPLLTPTKAESGH